MCVSAVENTSWRREARGPGVSATGGGGGGEGEAAARSDTVPGISMLGGDGVRSAREGRT